MIRNRRQYRLVQRQVSRLISFKRKAQSVAISFELKPVDELWLDIDARIDALGEQLKIYEEIGGLSETDITTLRQVKELPDLLIASHLTVSDMARRANISVPYMHRLEKNKHPSLKLSQAIRIAAILVDCIENRFQPSGRVH